MHRAIVRARLRRGYEHVARRGCWVVDDLAAPMLWADQPGLEDALRFARDVLKTLPPPGASPAP